MKIILKQDIRSLGEEGDIKTVADGYARNYLLPKGLCAPYSKAAINELEQKKQKLEKRKEEKRVDAMSQKERLEGEEITIAMPAGSNGKLFGAVTSQTIVNELEKMGIMLTKKNITIAEHTIKAVGNYTVNVKLYDSEALLKVKVEAAE